MKIFGFLRNIFDKKELARLGIFLNIGLPLVLFKFNSTTYSQTATTTRYHI
jgi:hypothetical protein